MKTSLKTLVVCSLLSALVACAGGGSGPSTPAPGQPPGLVDESGQVEAVQGEDPRKYYIANRPALNAVDADNDGIWDDVQQRLASSPAVTRAEPRVVRQLVGAYQDRLVTKTVVEAKANPSKFSYAMACHFYLEKKRNASDFAALSSFRELMVAVKSALFVSKERLLANEYADAMANGGRFDDAPETEESCR